jgi:hypothetical protein
MTPAEVDARLASVLKNVKAGKFVEDTWHMFALHYFRGCTDEEAARLLREWCDRHGIEPVLTEGRTSIGNQVFAVIRLRLIVEP